jgi:hypothetical protein
MKVIIVGQKNGKHKVNWLNYFILTFCCALVEGCGVSVVFYFLSGRWSHDAAFFGILIGVGTAAVGLIHGLMTPIEKLQPLP